MMTLINSVKSDIKYYIERINTLLNNKKEEKVNSMDTNINFRLGSDMASLVDNYVKKQIDEANNSFIGIVRKTILTYLKENLDDNILLLYHPVAVLGAVLSEYYNYLAPYYQKIIENPGKFEEEITKIFTKYKENTTTFLYALKHNQEEAIKIIELMEETINYKPLEESSNKLKNNQKSIEAVEKEIKKEDKNLKQIEIFSHEQSKIFTYRIDNAGFMPSSA